MDAKLYLSAYKILLNMFRVGLFDNPFLDEEESKAVVGCHDFTEMGKAAQRKSPVLLKKKEGILPLVKGSRVYIPKRHIESHYNFVRMKTKAEEIMPIREELCQCFFTIADGPEDAEAAIVFIGSPVGRNGFEFDMFNRGPQPDMGYYPISLQYRPYTASLAREVSLAGGDPRETTGNRSYKDRTEITANSADLDLILETRKAMGDKPVIVVVQMEKPTILAEFEAYADVILADFGVSRQTILEGITGAYEFSGKLPVIIPADMETVEIHCEDLVTDIRPYTDSKGNIYTLGYGFSGL